MRLKITAFKNCNKWTPVYRFADSIQTTEDKKFIF